MAKASNSVIGVDLGRCRTALSTLGRRLRALRRIVEPGGILRRKDLQILDRFGKPGRQAGEFIRAHMIAIDSKSRMYTGEAGNGRRIQRWILTGTRPAASVKPPQ